MKTFIIQRKSTGMYYNITGRGLGGTLWTTKIEDATKFDAPTKFHCLQSISLSYGECIAIVK
jgi:hypothetical protein